MNARVTTSSHLCASTRRFFFTGSNGGGGLKTSGSANVGGGVRSLQHHQHCRGPQRGGPGRGAWQWQTVRARLDVAVRPDSYREELDVKIEQARLHFEHFSPAPSSSSSSSSSSQEQESKEEGGEVAARPNKTSAAIALPHTEVFESARSHFRMRAEFRVWHDGDRR